MTDFQAAIAEVLAGHGIIDRKSRYSGAIFCTCGFHTEYTGRVYDQYRAHQAAMLAPIIRDAQAEALRAAADDVSMVREMEHWNPGRGSDDEEAKFTFWDEAIRGADDDLDGFMRWLRARAAGLGGKSE